MICVLDTATQLSLFVKLKLTSFARAGDRAGLFVRDEPGNEKTRCIECKASETARETKNQRKAFAEIEKSGATIVGAGKPGYEGGMNPPTKVDILRP
jgi:hypothetical protein